jgi:hypothetical protein
MSKATTNNDLTLVITNTDHNKLKEILSNIPINNQKLEAIRSMYIDKSKINVIEALDDEKVYLKQQQKLNDMTKIISHDIESHICRTSFYSIYQLNHNKNLNVTDKTYTQYISELNECINKKTLTECLEDIAIYCTLGKSDKVIEQIFFIHHSWPWVYRYYSFQSLLLSMFGSDKINETNKFIAVVSFDRLVNSFDTILYQTLLNQSSLHPFIYAMILSHYKNYETYNNGSFELINESRTQCELYLSLFVQKMICLAKFGQWHKIAEYVNDKRSLSIPYKMGYLKSLSWLLPALSIYKISIANNENISVVLEKFVGYTLFLLDGLFDAFKKKVIDIKTMMPILQTLGAIYKLIVSNKEVIHPNENKDMYKNIDPEFKYLYDFVFTVKGDDAYQNIYSCIFHINTENKRHNVHMNKELLIYPTKDMSSNVTEWEASFRKQDTTTLLSKLTKGKQYLHNTTILTKQLNDFFDIKNEQNMDNVDIKSNYKVDNQNVRYCIPIIVHILKERGVDLTGIVDDIDQYFMYEGIKDFVVESTLHYTAKSCFTSMISQAPVTSILPVTTKHGKILQLLMMSSNVLQHKINILLKTKWSLKDRLITPDSLETLCPKNTMFSNLTIYFIFKVLFTNPISIKKYKNVKTEEHKFEYYINTLKMMISDTERIANPNNTISTADEIAICVKFSVTDIIKFVSIAHRYYSTVEEIRKCFDCLDPNMACKKCKLFDQIEVQVKDTPNILIYNLLIMMMIDKKTDIIESLHFDYSLLGHIIHMIIKREKQPDKFTWSDLIYPIYLYYIYNVRIPEFNKQLQSVNTTKIPFQAQQWTKFITETNELNKKYMNTLLYIENFKEVEPCKITEVKEVKEVKETKDRQILSDIKPLPYKYQGKLSNPTCHDILLEMVSKIPIYDESRQQLIKEVFTKIKQNAKNEKKLTTEILAADDDTFNLHILRLSIICNIELHDKYSECVKKMYGFLQRNKIEEYQRQMATFIHMKMYEQAAELILFMMHSWRSIGLYYNFNDTLFYCFGADKNVKQNIARKVTAILNITSDIVIYDIMKGHNILDRIFYSYILYLYECTPFRDIAEDISNILVLQKIICCLKLGKLVLIPDINPSYSYNNDNNVTCTSYDILTILLPVYVNYKNLSIALLQNNKSDTNIFVTNLYQCMSKVLNNIAGYYYTRHMKENELVNITKTIIQIYLMIPKQYKQKPTKLLESLNVNNFVKELYNKLFTNLDQDYTNEYSCILHICEEDLDAKTKKNKTNNVLECLDSDALTVFYETYVSHINRKSGLVTKCDKIHKLVVPIQQTINRLINKIYIPKLKQLTISECTDLCEKSTDICPGIILPLIIKEICEPTEYGTNLIEKLILDVKTKVNNASNDTTTPENLLYYKLSSIVNNIKGCFERCDSSLAIAFVTEINALEQNGTYNKMKIRQITYDLFCILLVKTKTTTTTTAKNEYQHVHMLIYILELICERDRLGDKFQWMDLLQPMFFYYMRYRLLSRYLNVANYFSSHPMDYALQEWRDTIKRIDNTFNEATNLHTYFIQSNLESKFTDKINDINSINTKTKVKKNFFQNQLANIQESKVITTVVKLQFESKPKPKKIKPERKRVEERSEPEESETIKQARRQRLIEAEAFLSARETKDQIKYRPLRCGRNNCVRYSRKIKEDLDYVDVECSQGCHTLYHVDCYNKTRSFLLDNKEAKIGDNCFTPVCDGILSQVTIIKGETNKPITRIIKREEYDRYHAKQLEAAARCLAKPSATVQLGCLPEATFTPQSVLQYDIETFPDRKQEFADINIDEKKHIDISPSAGHVDVAAAIDLLLKKPVVELEKKQDTMICQYCGSADLFGTCCSEPGLNEDVSSSASTSDNINKKKSKKTMTKMSLDEFMYH